MVPVKHVVEKCTKIKMPTIVGSVNPNSVNKLRIIIFILNKEIMQ
jgi:hypothetical protein